jgi:ankyrin repeat protein
MNYQLYNGRTALMYSVLIPKSQPIAEILIQRGADINIKDTDGETVLTLALKGNYSLKIISKPTFYK